MSTKQNLKKILSVNITAVNHAGDIADCDMPLSEFLEYMNDLNEESCNDFQVFTATFLTVPWLDNKQASNELSNVLNLTNA